MKHNLKTLAGIIGMSFSAQAAYQANMNDEVSNTNFMFSSLNDNNSNKSSILNLNVSTFLAAHRSHSSHSSHRSSSSGTRSYSSTPNYSYTPPANNYIPPVNNYAPSKKSIVTDKMKRVCTNKGGLSSWDFNIDQPACKINGVNVSYDKLINSSKESDPLGQTPKIEKSIPPNNVTSLNNIKRVKLIKQVQLVLLLEGLYSGTVDGVMGDSTRSAINDFKKKHNLKSESFLGIETLNALGIKGF